MEKQKDNNHIECLAEESYKIMIINKFLESKIKLYKKYIDLTKNTIQNLLDKNISPIKLFDSFINEIKKDYENLNDELQRKYPKYKNLIDECSSDMSMGKPVLNQIRAEKFVLDYLITKEEDIINGLKYSIKESKKYHLFREPKRDSLIDYKKSNNQIEKITNEIQQNMLYECKQCNKFSLKIKKFNYKIEEIKKNIRVLKKYLKEEAKNSINNNNEENNDAKNEEKNEIKKKSTFKKFILGKLYLKNSVNIALFNENFGNEEQDQNKSEENNNHDSEDNNIKKTITMKINAKNILNNKLKPNLKKKNTIIKEFQKVEDLFNISSEEGEDEKLIDDELHSDDESVFEKKIKQPKKLTISYLNQIKKEIPIINLKQIEFNKVKIMDEADIYSLQRRQYKAQNIDNNIKDFKKKIERMNEKIAVIQKKEKVMKEYISKIKKKYENLKPMRHQNSVVGQKVKFIKKSLMGVDKITEEENEDDMGEGSFGSDYENEDNEESDKDKAEKNQIKHKADLKRSIFVGNFKVNVKNNKNLKKSVVDGIFINELGDKIKKEKRAHSK